MFSKKKNAGFTILEIMLAIAIAGAMIIVGLRFYQVYKHDSDTETIKANIDRLAQAAAIYYRANCYGETVSNTYTPSSLNSNSNLSFSGAFLISVPLDINTLVSSGYLASPPTNVPEVKSYVVQVTNSISPVIYGCKDSSCSSTYQKGLATDWFIQVSVLLNDTSNNALYQTTLGANCTSSARNGTYGATVNTVVPCSDTGAYNWECQHYSASLTNFMGCPGSNMPVGTSTPTYNNYLVFERRPAMPNAQVLPNSLSRKPAIDMFTQQYKNVSGDRNPNQRFTCGS